MRDARFYELRNAEAKRSGLILAQFEFLKTRQEAIETVMLSSTLWQRLIWLLRPKVMFVMVDYIQSRMLQESRNKMAVVSNKQNIAVARANGVQI